MLAALAGSIESVAATAGPVVEATADAAKGDDPERQKERLLVALRNLDAAMSEATLTVRAALQDIEGVDCRYRRRHVSAARGQNPLHGFPRVGVIVDDEHANPAQIDALRPGLLDRWWRRRFVARRGACRRR